MSRMKLDQPLGHYIDLPTRDQSVVRSFVVQPEATSPRGALVVLQHMDMRQPDWQGASARPQVFSDSRPGVNPHVRQMCERFAAEGFLAIAPSTFSRGQSGRDFGFRFEQTRWGLKLQRPLEPLDSQAVLADIEAGKLNIRSPIARALIGKDAGDSVEVKTPGGQRSYEILSIRFI